VAVAEGSAPALPRLPPWIRTHPPHGERYPEVRSILQELRLGTVCREARCPNLSECWSEGAATLMLLGTDCSRRCTFCAVTTHWSRGVVDASEPGRVGEAVARWGLRYVVLTQVCRDDLPDGGASILAATVRSIRARSPATLVELLAGDLGGDATSLRTLLEARPNVLAHNLETVPRLSPEVRDPRASYARSLEFLGRARAEGPKDLVTKSSLMIGLGESDEELARSFRDLRDYGVDLLTLGQYLRPSPSHRAVDRYLPPEGFDALAAAARAAGFAGVEAGPLVRSSYHAEALYRRAYESRGG
jgi:lipoic acid synthetase